jgi:hypothetical protein
MCYLENKRMGCVICGAKISTVGGIKHKCFTVLRENKRFGKCGRVDGPYNTKILQGRCRACAKAL